MAEGEAPVPHHGRVRLVRQHPVQQNRKDFSLHLYIAGIRKKKKNEAYITRWEMVIFRRTVEDILYSATQIRIQDTPQARWKLVKLGSITIVGVNQLIN